MNVLDDNTHPIANTAIEIGADTVFKYKANAAARISRSVMINPRI